METSTFFSPAAALWNHRQTLLNSRDRLLTLAKAVDWLNDLTLVGWGQWFTTTLEFRPDLIIELGRGNGNSTCVFTEAANQLGNCQVVSLCLSDIWQTKTVPRFQDSIPATWFQPLDARIGDILQTDFKTLLAGKQRVLVLWDAHGFEVAGLVLGHLLPLLKDRQHLVIMHDISDARYIDPFYMGYQDQGLWCGRSAGSERMILGHLNSAVAQAIAIVDFTSRNQFTLHSADHSFYTELSEDQVNTLKQELGSDWFNQNGHWFWFSLSEKDPNQPIHFPAYPTAITQEKADKAALETQTHQLQGQVEQLKQQIAADQADKAALEAQTHQLQGQVEQLKERIIAMESSKFWKLRSRWFTIKKTIGLE